MAKPHEEEWEIDADGDVRRLNKKGVRTSIVLVRAAGNNEARARLASKAPKMARALLMVRERGPWAVWMEDGKEVKAMDILDAVLREAGVLE